MTDGAVETILVQNAEVIRALGKRVVGDIIEIGRRLSESKKLCGHGNWSPWLSREFGWGDDTALRYMQVAELAKSRNLRNLSLPISGLYLLAAPSTPEEARQEVVERAENGEVLSVKDVRKLIEEARSKQEAETAELLAAREAQIRAEYVPGVWSRKRPPEPEAIPREYWLQFLRTKLHPVAEEVLPLMKAEEFAGLVKSIKAHGQLYPIILVEHDGEQVILDGVCREIACGIAGVEPKYRKIKVDDPRSYWISVNSQRVHLTRSQKAMGAAILTEPDQDEETYDPDQLPPPIVAARYVRAHAPGYVEAVIRGSMQLYDVYDLAVESQFRSQADRETRAELNRRRPDLIEQIERGTITLEDAWRVAFQGRQGRHDP
jgi:ParB-like chromosome segregation protein Spo0J